MTASASVFKNYDTCVADLLGGKPTKSLAIKLSKRAPEGFNGPDALRKLLASLDAACWKNPARSVAGNWKWRSTVPRELTSSPEVRLERAICRLDNLKSWSFQMSTCSGLLGKHTDKRRAIDLVRDYGKGRFAFVELKAGSDNPLDAAFELLGYYLAYLHARSQKHASTPEHDVMAAQHIELVVLGPDDWYEFGMRGAPMTRYNLDWLCREIVAGVRGLPILAPKTSFQFKRFPAGTDEGAQAAHIVSMCRDES